MKNIRKRLSAGNWKMYKSVPESVEAARRLIELTTDSDIEIVIAPPFTSLFSVHEITKNSKIKLGAQNMFWEKEGAFTGEISPFMLLSVGCRYVIIGHSERRQYFSEADETINRKIKASLDFGLIPIMCVGETESHREKKKTFSVLDKQMQKGLEGLTLDEKRPIVIAYEPVWAIGTGKTALPHQVQEVHSYLRSLIEKYFGDMLAKSSRILYGGSVKPDNVSELMKLPDVDGALVGGASLNPETFIKIIHY
jgi:triosephosphate isomerase (TIM)